MDKKIENFQILSNLGKGGMGEVYLAHDTICNRDVALKKMKEQWANHPIMRERFLREALIAAQLSHPSIIPIYSIDKKNLFYTMPAIAGETLKEILLATKEQTRNGEPLHPIGSSVPTLIRIFLNVCGAIAYTHAQGILHRDIKPDNIIVGKYGEVIILDWGLANFIGSNEETDPGLKEENPQLTLPGKIPGTLLYMAPERAFGAKSSFLTDIYSLGVVLYQILTLQYPFKRKSIKEFRKFQEHEKILDPEEVAPDRDISPHLSNIAKKCLAKNTEDRYQNIETLIEDVKNYIDGVPEWLPIKELQIKQKEDWEFQENVPLSRHMALTRGIDMLEWVILMVSKGQFPGNLKIETELSLKRNSKGLGILFCVPEHNLHKGAEESYCLWLSHEGVRLYRSNVEVLHHQEIRLETNKRYQVKIEHVDNHVRFFLDGVQKFGFLNHIPLPGSRVGLLFRDGSFTLSHIQLATGSQNIMVNCLAIPDAFLGRKEYDEALQEYRKISHSFPGRVEGREATFRAGITLLKKGAQQKGKKHQEDFFAKALDEFEKLHNTPSAPLEYLGKSLVYKTLGEFDEEAKCLELALRKFPKHPLKPILIENILSRLHESSQKMRHVAYRFAMIVLRFLSDLSDAHTLTNILETSLEPLPFFAQSTQKNTFLITQLAFWLNKPLVLFEMLEKGLSPIDSQNANVALLLLGYEGLSDFSVLEKKGPEIQSACFEYHLKTKKLPSDGYIPLWSALENKEWEKAKALIETLNPKKITDESDPHFFLYGCFLAKEKGEKTAIEHLTHISEKAFPPLYSLLSHYLMGRIPLKKGWIDQAFFWEKHKLLQQIELFSQCLGNKKLHKTALDHMKKLT